MDFSKKLVEVKDLAPSDKASEKVTPDKASQDKAPHEKLASQEKLASELPSMPDSPSEGRETARVSIEVLDEEPAKEPIPEDIEENK